MGALDGFRVIELCQGLCGPMAAMRLGDAGADVIKIEPPEGDTARRFGVDADTVDAPAFLAANRNKRSVVVRLDTEEGLAAVRQLIDTADVLVEDLGPGVAERLSLTAGREELVHCSISPFGDQGPWAALLGSELVIQAAAEQPLSLGQPGEPPLRIGAEIAALNTAIFASQAVTAALFAWDEEARSALRREMKVLVERLMKAAGPNAVADRSRFRSRPTTMREI